MNKEIKGVLQLLALILPVFALMITGWFFSPMYADVKTAERHDAQQYLNKTYYFPSNPSIDRKGMIEKYGLTDEEINPSKAFRGLLDAKGSSNESQTHCSQNLGALEQR